MVPENHFCRRNSLLIIFVLYGAFPIHNANPVEVTVEQGKLEGSMYVSRNGTAYHGYLGIPFAKPPVGELRFEPPQPPEPWQGVRNALKPPNECVQMNTQIISGHEDCLYLNVFTPAERTDSLPVMVYIHGGAFILGNAMFCSPPYFMDYPVVIVAIQYRLGLLGFLSTGDNVIPGNNAMKDQVAALKWVQQNIANFGGDPNRVTIFGNSAGSTSVHMHMHSHLSTGLFHKAISQSGSGLAPWAFIPRRLARERALAAGVLNGCPTKDTKRMVDCLKRVPADDILLSQSKFYVWKIEPVITFSLVAEPKNIEGAFLTENPWHQEVVNNVPWIVGVNSGEGGVIAMKYLNGKAEMATSLDAVYERLFPLIFYYGVWMDDAKKVSAVTEALKTFYFKDKVIGPETARGLVDLYSDGFFVFNSIEAARRYKGPVYFYYYDHRNSDSFKDFIGTFDIEIGACHVDELISLFNVTLFPNALNDIDLAVSKRMVNYWVNFAITGNPNSGDEVWTAIKRPNDLEYLHITAKQDIMKKDLLRERYSLWKGLQIEANYKLDNES